MVEMAVMKQLGNVFTQADADADDHFSDHVIGMEIDHLSALTRRVIRAYLHDSADKDIFQNTHSDYRTWEYAIIPS